MPAAWGVAPDAARVAPWPARARGCSATRGSAGNAVPAGPRGEATTRGPRHAARSARRCDGAAATEAAEREGRVQLAVRAVRLSLGRCPESGLGQGLLAAQAELLADVASAAVSRLAGFEAGAIRAALRAWGEWAEWADRQAQPAS